MFVMFAIFFNITDGSIRLQLNTEKSAVCFFAPTTEAVWWCITTKLIFNLLYYPICYCHKRYSILKIIRMVKRVTMYFIYFPTSTKTVLLVLRLLLPFYLTSILAFLLWIDRPSGTVGSLVQGSLREGQPLRAKPLTDLFSLSHLPVW